MFWLTTLIFSNKYCSILADVISASSDRSNDISNHLPNLLELSFLDVFAFPKDSSIGFVLNSLCSTPEAPPAVSDINCSTNFVDSVFPATDSPDTKIAWSLLLSFKSL